MLEIAVCDDNEIAAHQLASMITDILISENIANHVSVYSSARLLLQNVAHIHIIFLDLDMPKMNGIEAGKRIHFQKPECKIIMETGFSDRYKDAFRAHAIRFITKPFQLSEIQEALAAATMELIGENEIAAFYQRQSFPVKQKHIIYIHAYDGYVNIYTKTKVYRKDCSLGYMEQCLDQRLFFRIRQEYIVNLSFIESYRNGSVVIWNQTIPVSRRQKAAFEHAFMEFDFEYRGRLS